MKKAKAGMVLRQMGVKASSMRRDDLLNAKRCATRATVGFYFLTFGTPPMIVSRPPSTVQTAPVTNDDAE